jgi:hypothetical protein
VNFTDSRRSGSIVMFAIALTACRDRSYDAGTTTLSAARPLDLDGEASVQRLIDARCTREITCGNVGPGKYFPTFDACALSAAKTTRDELEPENCPSGVDPTAVDRCVERLRAEACPDAGATPQVSVVRRRPPPRSIEALGPLATCASRELCR